MNPRWLLIEIGVSVAALAVLVVAFRLDPEVGPHGAHVQMGLPPCGYYLTTGRPCLSCGLTTSITSMAHARPVQAWRANPAGIVLFLSLLAVPVWMAHSAWTSQDPLRLFRSRLGTWLIPAIAGSVVVTWMLRISLGWY